MNDRPIKSAPPPKSAHLLLLENRVGLVDGLKHALGDQSLLGTKRAALVRVHQKHGLSVSQLDFGGLDKVGHRHLLPPVPFPQHLCVVRMRMRAAELESYTS